MVQRSVPTNALPREQLASLRKLEKKIGYRYRDIHTLQKALIHRSYVNESEVEGLEDNERLEFVGDAVLQFVVSEYLYRNNPEEPEGSLTVMRSSIVARKRCAAMAKRLGLADFVLVGKGERGAAGGVKSSILANAFEALVASLYFDGGIEGARRFILKMVREYMPSSARADENFKARLQDISQKSGGLLPSYRLVSSRGPEHQKTFEVEVSIKGVPYGRGKGASKKEAEQQAARKALEKMPEADVE
jgi:ribonuclease-3